MDNIIISPNIILLLGFISFIFVNPYLTVITVLLGIFSLVRLYRNLEKGKSKAWIGIGMSIFLYFPLIFILLIAAWWATDKSWA
jgi:hypothetical protein